MESCVDQLFTYQIFSGNSRIEKMVLDTLSRYTIPQMLDDDEVEIVYAAGADAGMNRDPLRKSRMEEVIP